MAGDAEVVTAQQPAASTPGQRHATPPTWLACAICKVTRSIPNAAPSPREPRHQSQRHRATRLPCKHPRARWSSAVSSAGRRAHSRSALKPVAKRQAELSLSPATGRRKWNRTLEGGSGAEGACGSGHGGGCRRDRIRPLFEFYSVRARNQPCSRENRSKDITVLKTSLNNNLAGLSTQKTAIYPVMSMA